MGANGRQWGAKVGASRGHVASGRTPRVTTANGHGGTDEQDEPPRLGEVPVAILELSESCRQFVQRALGVELDYEAETLPVLDAYLQMAGGGVVDRPEAEPLVARTVAAYFGEVVRRRVDGLWRRRPELEDEWQLCARRTFLSLSPLGIVLESLARGADHPGPSAELSLAPDDRAVAESRLAVLPPVSEDEYYLLSTRLEVIETVYEALRERMKAEGRESVVYEEADYDDE
jgi:hypothetical protein